MATRRQAAAAAVAAAGAVPAQERRGDAARIVRRPKAMAGQQPTTRRALVDVGNLLDARAAEGNNRKPLYQAVRATTTSLGAPSRANPRASAVACKKAVVVLADRCGKAAKQKPTSKPKPKVTVISSPSEKEKKDLCQKVSQRSPIRTLTSLLTTCSRASDGVLSSPNKPIHDIDAPDVHNELAVVDYVEDIYKFYKSAESTSQPCGNYMSSQAEINERMRAILTDWLIEVHHRFALMPETLYLTVHVIDQYLSMESVPRRELQLVGMSAMLIACKYEEIWAPKVKDFICISDNAYNREQVLGKEKSILNKLQWNLTVPTMYVFILRYLKAAQADKELENMTFFYTELALVQCSMLAYSPSMTAAAAVYAAQCTLDVNPQWSNVLKYHTGFSESLLLDCARCLMALHSAAPQSKQKAVYKKYCSPKLGAVALHSPAERLL